jgi:protein-disulfide isomerase
MKAAVAALTLTLGLAAPAFAQSSDQDIRQQLAALREAQQAMAKDVEAIRALLQQAMGPRPAPAGAGGGAVAPAAPGGAVQPLTIAGRPSKGNPRARVTLIEYSDYECPFCAQYVNDTGKQLDRDYVRTNKINYVFKNYPIAQLHKNSFKAHKAAACAADQGRFWEMHDTLFTEQRSFDLDRFMENAAALKIDPVTFRACIESGDHEDMIQQDIAEAQRGGVQGTPVFVLAYTDPAGKTIVPAKVIIGAQPYSAFQQAIDAMLAQAPTPTTAASR